MKLSNNSKKVSLFSGKTLMPGRKFGNITLAAGLAALLVCGGNVTFRPTAAKAETNQGAIAQATAEQKVIYVNSTQGSDRPGSGLSNANAYRTISYALQQAQKILINSYIPKTPQMIEL